MEKPTLPYLESVRKQFVYYKTLGEKAIAQLEADQLFARTNEDTNSIAMIVNHLSGNMLSRWTDFLTSDGEKPWRDRDSEFEETLNTKEQVMLAWEKGWTCFFAALDALTDDQLSQIIYIRNEGHTVMEAINRQLAHYPYHVGQIVFCAKMLKKSQWDSLSIPKNASKTYNSDKFAKEKSVRHFTDDELDRIK
ncbi:DUF1572 family protein [Flavobacterium sp. MAH-1]|uniref:DUF1572 family protein n=1 Tax=Flavobacterium agri TaxID=2743471 RepID=A0A7Y9C4J7_9FLAO|nr:DUF1572 family protein [Flavobacterium agri]NUY79370.1 DUF1572 family protein [Flavobacterium agri]NYA69394.1 DUF1572 family protein [Flavobacterium agri]